jgi:hypothetical protein
VYLALTPLLHFLSLSLSLSLLSLSDNGPGERSWRHEAGDTDPCVVHQLLKPVLLGTRLPDVKSGSVTALYNSLLYSTGRAERGGRMMTGQERGFEHSQGI